MNLSQPVKKLLKKGVRMPNPFSVEIGEEVDTDRVSAFGVTLYGGTRITGENTFIGEGVTLGEEAPAVLHDCGLGKNVELKGGFFTRSVFLDRTVIASGAHIRENCLLEEEVKTGQAVGLKQTILFPFVTLGSLINFCDILMAGGTSRKNHSEVGSSYIHFNFTPNQDKATPSLLGDVPRGVMLRESPLFLGGQGGLIGPSRLGFGTVVAAGEVWNGDSPEGGKLLRAGKEMPTGQNFHPGLYFDIQRRVLNNILYYANLTALRLWYIHVRDFLAAPDERHLMEKARTVIDGAAAERLARFRALAKKMEESIELGKTRLPKENRRQILERQIEFYERWDDLEGCLTSRLEESADVKDREDFLYDLAKIKKTTAKDYVSSIAALDASAVSKGSDWLKAVVNDVAKRGLAILPSFR
jgi:UDP-N-acetylglucosamine/UDP-N-acetylgalactosamine diphosphorylase